MNSTIQCEIIGREDILERQFEVVVDLKIATVASLNRHIVVRTGCEAPFRMYCGDARIDQDSNALLSSVIPEAKTVLIRCDFSAEQTGFFSGLKTKLAAVGLAAAFSPAAVTAGVSAAGFGTGGITGGSYAAAFMASYGGAVPAGSACATLQSIGAVGLAGPAVALIAGSVAAVGGGVVYASHLRKQHQLTRSLSYIPKIE